MTLNNDNKIAAARRERHDGHLREAGPRRSATSRTHIDVSTKGDIAVVGNIGGAADDAVILVDLTGATPRVVTQAGGWRDYRERGAVSPMARLRRRDGHKRIEQTAAAAPIIARSGLLQGLQHQRHGYSRRSPKPTLDTGARAWLWKRDSKMILVQCVNDREIKTFGFDGRALTSGPAITIAGGPAGIRASTR